MHINSTSNLRNQSRRRILICLASSDRRLCMDKQEIYNPLRQQKIHGPPTSLDTLHTTPPTHIHLDLLRRISPYIRQPCLENTLKEKQIQLSKMNNF